MLIEYLDENDEKVFEYKCFNVRLEHAYTAVRNHVKCENLDIGKTKILGADILSSRTKQTQDIAASKVCKELNEYKDAQVLT